MLLSEDFRPAYIRGYTRASRARGALLDRPLRRTLGAYIRFRPSFRLSSRRLKTNGLRSVYWGFFVAVVMTLCASTISAQSSDLSRKNPSATYTEASATGDKIENFLSHGEWTQARRLLVVARRKALSGFQNGDRDVAELLSVFDYETGLVDQLVSGNTRSVLKSYRESLEMTTVVEREGGVWWNADDLRAVVLKWKSAAELRFTNPQEAIRDLQTLSDLNERRIRRDNSAYPTVDRDLQSQLGGATTGGQVGSLTVANLAVTLAKKLGYSNKAANELALTNVLRSKGRQLDRIGEGMRFFHEHSPAEYAAYMQLLSLQSQYAIDKWINKAQPRRLRNEILRLEQTSEQLKGALAKLRLSAKGAIPPPITEDPITPAAVSLRLPEKTVLVEIFVYRAFDPTATERNGRAIWLKPKYAMFLLDETGAIRVCDLGDADRVDQLIDQFRADLHQVSDLSALRRTGTQLSDLVWKPIQEGLRGGTVLFVSPDGRLNLVPFGALFDRDGDFVIKQFSVRYLSSGRDLLRSDNPQSHRGQPFVAVYPCFDDKASCASPESSDICSALPVTNAVSSPPRLRSRSFDPTLDVFEVSSISETLAEGCDLHRLFPQASFSWGAAATESSIKAARSPSILHVATHGYYIPSKFNESDQDLLQDESIEEFRMNVESFTYPERWRGRFGPFLEDRTLQLDSSVRSGIALAGANVHASDDGEDGILTALEMSALDLSGTEMAVLSACETGLGDVVDRGGPSGLRRALAIAGAETQVISLWSVNDDTTRDLMARFYARLIDGIGRGEALRQAQLDLLNSPDPTIRHPYYWASFIESGNWEPLTPDVREQSKIFQ